MVNGGRGINPVAMTILGKELVEPRIETTTPCFQVLYATYWTTGAQREHLNECRIWLA